MDQQKLREAWQEPVHADFFDGVAKVHPKALRRDYESFNESRLLLEHKRDILGRDFVEIGCATGELYRYLRQYHPEFSYRGFDISRPAIERARQKYPNGIFEVCEPNLSDVIAANLRPSVIWARDVVLHQPEPFEYLSKLMSISSEVTVLRIRTRDKGASILDLELSCQWHYNHWVPYLILNVDETVDVICKAIPVERMFLVKRYVQLGGWHNRFVPKECYYPETDTAETALYILRSNHGDRVPDIMVSEREESHPVWSDPLWMRGIRYIRRILSW